MKQPITIDHRAISCRERMFKKYGARLARGGSRFRKSLAATTDDIEDEEPRWAIEGLCIEADTPILNKHGDTIIFEPTAFDKYFESGSRPQCWLRHDPTKVIGSNVELCLLNEGVAFRFDIPKDHVANIRKMVETGEQAAISIGFKEIETRDDVCFGHPVKRIVVADMIEVSLVPVGASKRAFARIIDARRELALHLSVNSPLFAIEYDMHHVKSLKRDNDAALQRIAGKLPMLEDALPEQHHVERSAMTIDQSNSRNTDSYDRMRTERRTHLGV